MTAVLQATFPAVLLEGYETSREFARKVFPRAPRAVITANAHTNELFCLWAAEQSAPLVILQHGGHYGVDLIEMMEDHELEVADIYCSWGWQRHDYANVLPMPAFKLQTAREAPRLAQSWGLLAVYDSAHRYPYRIFSIPIAGQRLADNARQLELLAALPSELRRQLRIRCHPLEDGFGFRAALKQMGLGESFDKSTDMLSAIKSARLCLIGSNSTPLLESLCSGTPTLAFYDPAFAEERSDAKPYFDALRAAGILHVDPEACAAKIVAVWADPEAWWCSDVVLHARTLFVQRFALTAPDHLARWRLFIARLSKTKSDWRKA